MAESVVTSSDMMNARFLQAYRLWDWGGKQGNVAIVTRVVQDVEKVFNEGDGVFYDEIVPKVEVYDLVSNAAVFLDEFYKTCLPGDVVAYEKREQRAVMIKNFTADLERSSYEQIVENARKAYRLVFGNIANGK